MPRLTPDEKWKRFNTKLEKLMRENDFFGLGTTYYEMADFLDKEGRPSSYLRKEGYKAKFQNARQELERLKDMGVESVEIMGDTEQGCVMCKRMNGKVFSTREALNTDPIPLKDCSHKYGCRCVYAPNMRR